MSRRTPAPPPLRARAEAALEHRGAVAGDEAARLLHELDVHRVELELQNEELRQAREATEAALARYTEVFEFAPIGYAVLDAGGAISEINHAGARLLGAARTRLVGKRFAGRVTGESCTKFDELVRAALAEPGAAHAELELATDRPTTVRVTIAALRVPNPTLLVAFEDISDRKEQEAELARSEHALRLANERKDEFLAMLSHELRNPLSPIHTGIAVLRLVPPGSAAAAETLDIVERSTRHLTRLVEDLLDVTRITRGKIELRRESVDLVELVRRTAIDHDAELHRASLQLELRLPPHAIWVNGDPVRLVQVASNLLGNATKFTPAGGRVTVTLELRGCDAVVVVSDTGIGIAPDHISGLFDPFVQVPQALDRGQGGLGLGLAVAKSIVELHGGRITLASPGLGRGTEVIFTIPAEPAARAAARQPVPAATAHRVLVVEDNADTLASLRALLVLMGYRVATATTGREALAVARTFAPDVVLCDIGLPDLDGYAVATAIRADPDLRGIHLVALSGYARPEDVARSRRAGFEHHLAKPAGPEELRRVFAALIPNAGG